MKNSDYTQIEDLLKESGLLYPKESSRNFSLNFDFSDETILITGAAGSIGSEIVRQLLSCSFKSLILIDNAESSLSNLVKEFKFTENLKIEFILLDIRDDESLQWLFETFNPTMVFHTAAYKHVPLMEDNAYEAVKLNILATKSLTDISILHNVKKFIFISTDKAVNPISVMGMSKRIAESYLNYLNSKKKTLFLTTRFGNILGSSGSVLPIFLKQIKSGKALTVTNTETSRYFITKSKACRFILEIASWSKSNDNLFTFNMGKPIKIIDFAKVLVDLTGGKSTIKIIGLRAGEKMHEEIFSNEESLEPTTHIDIFKVTSKKTVYSEKAVALHELKSIAPSMPNNDIKSILETCIYKLQLSPTFLFAI